jgi:hypothetical protein
MVYIQVNILQVQTLNITVKDVLSCKSPATHFMHVIVLEKNAGKRKRLNGAATAIRME